MLLSTVFDYKLYDSPQYDHVDYRGTVLADNRVAVVGRDTTADWRNLILTGGSGQSGFSAAGANHYLWATDTSSSGALAAYGRYATSDPDSVFLGFGVFQPQQQDPFAVLYGDKFRPTASLLIAGADEDGSQTAKITIRYRDNILLDAESIDGNELEIIDEDGELIEFEFIGLDRQENGPIRYATYQAQMPSHSGGRGSDWYQIYLKDESLEDLAEQSAERDRLGSVSVSPDGVNGLWSQPDELAEEPTYDYQLAAIAGDVQHDTVLFSDQHAQGAGSPTVAFLLDDADDAREIVWWDASASGDSASDGIFARTPVTGLGMDLVRMAAGNRLLAETYGSDARLVLFPGAGQAGETVIRADEVLVTDYGGEQSALVGVKWIKSPDLSEDGEVITFLGSWGSGGLQDKAVFAAVQIGDEWHVQRLTGYANDGVYEFDEGHDWGAPIPYSKVRVSPLLAGPHERFSVVFDRYHLLGRSVWMQRVTIDRGASGADILVPGVPEPVVTEAGDLLYKQGVQEREWGDAYAGAQLLSDVEYARLLDRPINKDGTIAIIIERTDIEGLTLLVVRDQGPRPVLIIPGVGAVFPKDTEAKDDYISWLMERGVHPDRLETEQIQGSYNDLAQSLIMNGGYVEGETLFHATYDWRLPPAPLSEDPNADPAGPMVRPDINGIIDGITFSPYDPDDPRDQPVFRTGVDYLVYWLLKAKAAWAASHESALDTVDIIAHSTGGLVARAYVQSEIYRTEGLPGVTDLVLAAVPHRGSIKAWNPLHDNWSENSVYRMFFSFIVGAAYDKVMEDRQVIVGPDVIITWAEVKRVQEAYGAYRNDREAFIALYVPTVRTLMAEPLGGSFWSDADKNAMFDTSGWASYIGGPYVNTFLADLNVDDGNGGVHTRQVYHGVRASIVGGMNGSTSLRMIRRVGPECTYLSEEDPSSKVCRTPVYSMTDGWRTPLPGEIWWEEVHSRRHNYSTATAEERAYGRPEDGDGTVPTESAAGFGGHWSRVHMYEGVEHVEVMYDEDTQRAMLRELGYPAVDISTDLVGNLFTGIIGVAPWWWVLGTDPVEVVVTDAKGRRFGWTEADGPLTEIPGSGYLGEGDGIGWLSEPVEGPVSIRITGINSGRYAVRISGEMNGSPFEWSSEGNLGVGETRNFTIEVPVYVSTSIGDTANLRATADEFERMTVTTVNDVGRAIALQQAQRGGNWYVVDLANESGSDPIYGTIESWVDPKDGLTYAAGLTSTGLLLYQQTADGSWNFRDIGQETAGANLIVSDLLVMTSPDGTVNLTGLDANGDLIRYFQDGSSRGQGHYRWYATNLGDHLRGRGQQMPAVAGNLVGYATSWGGLNVVGLDAKGAIWGIWWAPGASGWSASDLSTIYGADPIVGGLTVYLTSWKGINIAGIDASGHLQVTWWLPSFGGKWSHSDLTSIISGAILDPDSVSSFVSSWGGMNVAGLDQTTGKVKVYWWAPGVEGWAVSTLSEVVGDGEPVPTRALRGMATPAKGGSLNVFGIDASDGLIRYYWEPGFGGNWVAQNLSELP